MWIIGNWKMHGTGAMLGEIAALAAAVAADDWPAQVTLAVCPPFPLLERAARAAGDSALLIGAQDVHAASSGAHTGDVCAAMLLDAGASLVIIGHSERRADCGETDATARAKATAALASGLTAVLCVGETGRERDAGRALAVIAARLAGSLPEARAGLLIAYEPVWAIGTGRTPTVAEVAEVHALIRGIVGPAVPILYGGSVGPANAAALLAVPNVDGALVGGASLRAESLLAIACAADAVSVDSAIV